MTIHAWIRPDGTDALHEFEPPGRPRSDVHDSGGGQYGFVVLTSSLPLRWPQMDAPMGDNHVAPESLIAELRGRPIGHPPATSEAPTAPRGATPPGAWNVAYGLLPLETAQPNSAAGSEKGGGTASLMEVLPQVSRDASFVNGSPSVMAPVGDSGRAADQAVSRAGSPRPDSAGPGEGGLIDIDIPSERSSPFSIPSQQTPLANRSKIVEKSDPGKSISQRTGEADQRGDPMRLAGDEDQPAARPSTQYELSEEAPRDLRPASDSTEGGMIELAAVVPPSAGSSGSPPPSVATADQRQAADVKEIRMESGVALFHAFDLATAPTQEGDRPSSAWTGASQSGPLPETTAPSTAPDSAAAEAVSAGNTPEAKPVQGVRVLQAIAVALWTVAIDRVRREDEHAVRQRRGQGGHTVSRATH